MQLSDLQSAVESRVNDDTSPTYSTTEINNGLNAAQLVFAFLTLCLEKTATLTVGSPWVNVLSSDADYIVPLRIRASDVKIRPATLAAFAAANPGWWTNGSAAANYAARGPLLFFDGAVASVSLTYAYAPPALALSTDVPVIPADYHPRLADYAAWRLMMPQGGQELDKAKRYLAAFMAGAQELAQIVRTRSLAQRYDTLPPERERFDLSRVLKVRPDLLPGRKEAPPSTPQ